MFLLKSCLLVWVSYSQPVPVPVCWGKIRCPGNAGYPHTHRELFEVKTDFDCLLKAEMSSKFFSLISDVF